MRRDGGVGERSRRAEAVEARGTGEIGEERMGRSGRGRASSRLCVRV